MSDLTRAPTLVEAIVLSLGDELDSNRWRSLGGILSAVFIVSLDFFVVPSIKADLHVSFSQIQLIIARAFQGAAGALLLPQVLSIIQVTFPAKGRQVAFGLFSTVIGISSFSGNVFGGPLVYANFLGLQWRPIFLVNLPIGLATLWAAVALVKESRSPKARRLDLGGVAIVSVALAMLLYPVIEGKDAG